MGLRALLLTFAVAIGGAVPGDQPSSSERHDCHGARGGMLGLPADGDHRRLGQVGLVRSAGTDQRRQGDSEDAVQGGWIRAGRVRPQRLHRPERGRHGRIPVQGVRSW